MDSIQSQKRKTFRSPNWPYHQMKTMTWLNSIMKMTSLNRLYKRKDPLLTMLKFSITPIKSHFSNKTIRKPKAHQLMIIARREINNLKPVIHIKSLDLRTIQIWVVKTIWKERIQAKKKIRNIYNNKWSLNMHIMIFLNRNCRKSYPYKQSHLKNSKLKKN